MNADISPLTERMAEVLAPLGEEEERRAIAAALEVGRERRDWIVRGAELAIEKPPRRGDRPLRRVRVLLSIPADSAPREIVVDEGGRVVSDRELEPRNLPFNESEVAQARAIAERDPEVAERLRGYKVGVGVFAPALAGAGRHRLVGLHFLDGADPNLPKALVSVVVDLATGRRVSDPHGHASHEEA